MIYLLASILLIFSVIGIGSLTRYILNWPQLTNIPLAMVAIFSYSFIVIKEYLQNNPENKNNQQTIAYLRVSSSPQDIKTQLNEILDFANKKGIEIKECPELDKKGQ